MEADKPQQCLPVTWDLDRLSQPPATSPADGFAADGVDAIFFEGEPLRGEPTRVFAWMALPDRIPDEGCPAMVLLHGGGGTAFQEWVRIWNRRGYAAITFDQCGCVPERPGPSDGGPHERHEHGGPPGWGASFEHVNEPIEDQWPHHAVAAALRAHSLLAAQPGVDPTRIGVTGISWGGYLTCLVSGVDRRLKCAVPVYGCGFLGRNSTWKDSIFPGLPAADVDRWLELWDPSQYLPHAGMPVCWLSGTNDLAYPLDSLQASSRLPTGERTLCIRIEMPHSHPDGWAPAEIGQFVDSILAGSAPLIRIARQGLEGGRMWTAFSGNRPVKRAELCYTRALGHWTDRKYNVTPARVDPEAARAEAAIPPDTSVCFLNLYDDSDCVVSTEHVEVAG